MIAYLEKYNTTVEVPDDATQEELSDINQNFHSYTGQENETKPVSPEQPGATPTQPTPAPAPEKFKPNFYESYLRPLAANSSPIGLFLNAIPETKQEEAAVGGAAKEVSFGALDKQVGNVFGESMKEHPVYATAGEFAGGIGSLMESGTVVGALGVGEAAGAAGKLGVEVGLPVAQRFIPRAIMSGATFGTRTFIADTVKAFHEGGVDLEQFGKDVLKDTAFGGIFGSIGGLGNRAAGVASAYGLGFVSAKMDGADNLEAHLRASIWGAGEFVGSIGKTPALREEVINNLKDSVSEYFTARNPGVMGEKGADRIAALFVDNEIKNAGFESAEALAKEGPAETMKVIERINQRVRQGIVPEENVPRETPIPPRQLPSPEEIKPAPEQTPVEKAVDIVKKAVGIEEPKTAEGFVSKLPEEHRAAVAKARAELQGQRSTKQVNTDYTGSYTPERQELHQEIVKSFEKPEAVAPEGTKPKAVIVIGPPASGKSTIIKKIPGSFVEIDNDAMKEKLPDYTPTRAALYHEEASDIEKQVIQNTASKKMNLVLSSVGRSMDKIKSWKDDLAKQGYDISLIHMKVEPEEAARSAVERHMRGGRFVDPDYIINDVGSKTDVTYEKLKKEIPNAAQYEPGPKGTEPKLREGTGEVGRLSGRPDNRSPSGTESTPNLEQIREELKSAGHDITKIPEKKIPDDLHDVYQFEKNRSAQESIKANLGELNARLKEIGLSDKDEKALSSAFGLRRINGLGHNVLATETSEIFKLPHEQQTVEAYKALAESRGIKLEGPINGQLMEQADKAAEMIRSHFDPTLGQIKELAINKKEQSDYDVAQMAYDRGLIEQPNNDLLKAELSRAKSEPPPFQPPVKKIEPRGIKLEPQVVSSMLQESATEIKNIVNPTSAAPLAARITREKLGQMARSYDRATAAMESATKYFSKRPKEENIDFIDRVERGFPQPNKELQGAADVMRKMLDDKRKEIQSLGTGKLEAFIENYFPHIWDQGEKEVGQVIQKAAKRPLEGRKSFLKKRKIEFTKDGIDLGLTPVSYNPVDLVLLKLREMDKYLMAHKTINEYKANGLAQFVRVGQDAPEGWVQINDKISTVFKSPLIMVKEAFDEKMMNDLVSVANSLGIDLERKVSIGRKGMHAGVWGYSEKGPQETASSFAPGKITTKFAGPESVLAHELGHQLDNIYGFQDMFLSQPEISDELTKLANERAGDEASGKFKTYIQKPEEKMAVMLEAYIHAPELFKETAPKAFEKLNSFLKSQSKLQPLTEIKPSLVLGTAESQVSAGGAVIAGHIYAQPDAARLINNYLAPGLQRSAIFQAYRYAGNLINQFQLGFSAFHLGFTSVDAMVSKFALALNQLTKGKPIKAIRDALAVPVAPVSNIIRGNQLFKAWREGGQTHMDEIMAQVMASAGGRVSMDQFYSTRATDQVKHLFQSGKPIQGLLRVPMAVAEISSKPILEYIVPRQKLGVFADIVKMELEANPNMSHDEMRQMAQKAWDSVDNRMGQLVYDNLFWNRTFKDLLMGSVRSVGWNLGTLRELVGGGTDYVENIGKAARGKKPEFTYKMAYITALPILVGAMGAIYQYLRTGKGPQEMKDYFFPKTGGLDSNGDPQRVAFPSYMKDVYHYTQDPVKTVSNKLNPIISVIEQMLANRDYYGTKIRNEDDPLVRQVMSEVKYLLKQAEPFSLRNLQAVRESGNTSLSDAIQPWIGITPAPYDINQSKAEKLSHEISASHQQVGGRTEEQSNRSRLASQLARRYKQGDPNAVADMTEAYRSGQISHTQFRNIIIHSQMTPLQRMVNGMTVDEAKRVYDKATDEEKAQLQVMIERKIARHQTEYSLK